MRIDPSLGIKDPQRIYEALRHSLKLTPVRIHGAGYATTIGAIAGAKKYAERQGLPWPPLKEGA